MLIYNIYFATFCLINNYSISAPHLLGLPPAAFPWWSALVCITAGSRQTNLPPLGGEFSRGCHTLVALTSLIAYVTTSGMAQGHRTVGFAYGALSKDALRDLGPVVD